MPLVLYDTLTRTKQPFRPLDPSNVRMYVCGPTVYGEAHIGNARPVIVFDVLFRLLRHLYGDKRVTYVRNITDVDDKINARAKERGIPIRQLTDETARVYQEDARALGCLDPTHEPRVTDHIAEIVDMIGRLIRAEAAYVAEGHVLYSVESKADYGKLARRALDEMIAGARVDVAPYKKNPMDFVLWKPSDAETPGWDSPWGRGRPGWHIECSAMGEKLLGETFDIHGGGIDLVFPHHENEIAQSESAHGGKPLASIWMHNGFLQVEGEKMSKSLGNFFTIRELLAKYPGDVLRFQMLQTHYRQPIDWTDASAEATRRELFSWSSFLEGQHLGGFYHPDEIDPDVLEALSDDLNTPAAMGAMRNLFSLAPTSTPAARRFASTLHFLGARTIERPGLLQSRSLLYSPSGGLPKDWLPLANAFRAAEANNLPDSKSSVVQQFAEHGYGIEVTPAGYVSVAPISLSRSDLEAVVRKLVDARTAARKAKNWAEADRLRAELTAMGVAIEDGPGGTTWKVAP